jgi:GNAT superfamily N-acetyltransferase
MKASDRKVDFRIDTATETDVPALLRMIRSFAEYERLSHMVAATEEGLRAALFGPRPAVEAIIAHAGYEPAGFAVFFFTFSTFAGRAGLYLEDLYVEPRWRRRGFGRRLLAYVARVAADRGCDRMNWSVLDWNEPALSFYRSLGAEEVQDWVGYRLAGEGFSRLTELGRREKNDQGPGT